MSDNTFSIEKITWWAGNAPILQDVSLSIAAGSVTGIIGPNGAGKTSLMRCLAGFYQPQQGQISYSNKPLSGWSANALAQQLALVSQQPVFELSWTVEQLVGTGLVPYKRWFEGNSEADQALLSKVIAEVGLTGKQHRLLQTLSGGELQRALLAKALVQQPNCLLLDEPTNHLDLRYQHELMQLIRSLPMTVVACVHDMNLAAQYCDQLILLKQGKVLAQGAIAEVFNAANLSALFDCPVRVDPHPYRPGLWMNFVASGQT